MKTVLADFGNRQISIDVPEHAEVIEFEDRHGVADPVAATVEAIQNPHGSRSLSELAGPGMRVAIGFDDPTRPAMTVQTIIPVLIRTLLDAGVGENDIRLICACSNHRKPTGDELAEYLGATIYDRFGPSGQILNHDCSDPSQLSFLGISKAGKYPVELNRHFVEADLMIYVGNVSATGFRSYTGTGVVIGLASTRSIASHHSLDGIPQPGHAADKKVAKPRHSVKDDISALMEEATGKRVFYVNAVPGGDGKLAGVFAGSARDVRKPAWAVAETISRYPASQADVLIIGIPDRLGLGSADNTLIAASGILTPPRLCPEEPILREGGVVIGLSPSRGYIDPERYPSYQAAIDLYARYQDVRSLVDHEEAFDQRADYRALYTDGHAYPALHPFWLLYQYSYTLARAAAVIMAGTTNSEAFRALGILSAPDFEAAWTRAVEIVGEDPVTVVAPTYWSRRSFKFDVKKLGGD
jgi:lactate racemase